MTIATTNVYDAAGRVTMTIDAHGNMNQTFYTPGGKVDHTIDQFGNTNRFLYDARENLIQTISPFGTNCTVFDDNARSILTTDRNGISGTLTIYDLAVNGSVLSIDTNACPATVEALWRGSCEWNMAGRFTM